MFTSPLIELLISNILLGKVKCTLQVAKEGHCLFQEPPRYYYNNQWFYDAWWPVVWQWYGTSQETSDTCGPGPSLSLWQTARWSQLTRSSRWWPLWPASTGWWEEQSDQPSWWDGSCSRIESVLNQHSSEKDIILQWASSSWPSHEVPPTPTIQRHPRILHQTVSMSPVTGLVIQTTATGSTTGTTSTRQQSPTVSLPEVSPRPPEVRPEVTEVWQCIHGCHWPDLLLRLSLLPTVTETVRPHPHLLPFLTTARFLPKDQEPPSKLASWWSWRRSITTTDIFADPGDWSWQRPWDWLRDRSRSGSRTEEWRPRRRDVEEAAPAAAPSPVLQTTPAWHPRTCLHLQTSPHHPPQIHSTILFTSTVRRLSLTTTCPPWHNIITDLTMATPFITWCNSTPRRHATRADNTISGDTTCPGG